MLGPQPVIFWAPFELMTFAVPPMRDYVVSYLYKYENMFSTVSRPVNGIWLNSKQNRRPCYTTWAQIDNRNVLPTLFNLNAIRNAQQLVSRLCNVCTFVARATGNKFRTFVSLLPEKYMLFMYSHAAATCREAKQMAPQSTLLISSRTSWPARSAQNTPLRHLSFWTYRSHAPLTLRRFQGQRTLRRRAQWRSPKL